jgi:hypothetical protein
MSKRLEVQPQYGKWTVIEEAQPRVNGNGFNIRHIRVRCACGTDGVVKLDALHRGGSLGCRECNLVKHHPAVGTPFGDLVVLEIGIKVPGRDNRRVKVRCVCGEEKLVLPAHLISGNIKSCGCRKLRCGLANPRYKGAGEIGGSYFRSMEWSARQRNLSFDVTIEHLWGLYLQQNRKCALTGLSIHMRSHGGRGTASLDRINSDLPYQEGNVQWVHKVVNLMKGLLGQQVFVAFCEAVSRFQGDSGLTPEFLEGLL